ADHLQARRRSALNQSVFAGIPGWPGEIIIKSLDAACALRFFHVEKFGAEAPGSLRIISSNAHAPPMRRPAKTSGYVFCDSTVAVRVQMNSVISDRTERRT